MALSLGRREKIMLTGLLSAALVFCFSYFLLIPQTKAYSKVKSELIDSRSKLAQSQKTVASLKQESELLEKTKEKVEEKGRVFNTEMRGGYNVILLGMKQAAEDIEITGVEPGKIKENPHSLEIPIKIEVQGDFRNLLTFFTDLDKLVGKANDLNLSEMRTLKIESLNSSSDSSSLKNSGGASGPGYSSGMVKATMGITIFSAKNPEGRVYLEEISRWLTGRYNIFRTASYGAPIPVITNQVKEAADQTGTPQVGAARPTGPGSASGSKTGISTSTANPMLKSSTAKPEPEYLLRK